MKKVVFLLFSSLILMNNNIQASQNGYNISLEIKNLANKEVILVYYFNKQMYVSDTALTNQHGKTVFEGEEPLQGGLYFFYLPNGKHFDVLIDKEQYFAISTDTANLINNMQISNSEDAQLFLNYQKFLNKQQIKANELNEKLNSNDIDSKEKEKLIEELQNVNKEVNDYWDDVINKHPDSFTATFIKSMQEPSLPDFDIPSDSDNPDSLLFIKQYDFFRHHYFDNIDLRDERLLRTPFFTQRLDNYFTRGLIQAPDTVALASIELIEKSADNEKMFRFILQYCFNRANESNIMGMDAVMVELAEKYYLTGKATWVSDQFLETLQERINAIKPTLIGNTASNLVMTDINGNKQELFKVEANITIITFFEPSCGHCKVEIPNLYKEIYLKYRDKGLEFFTVYTLDNKEEWNDFIEKYEMTDWINVYDPYNQSGFRQNYDVRATPMIYVLDKDKKIVAKKIDSAQLPGFIEFLLTK